MTVISRLLTPTLTMTTTRRSKRGSAHVAARRPMHTQRFITACLAVMTFATVSVAATAQEVHVRDLAIPDGSTPVRLLGYGIVVGLDGTGDRGTGGKSGGQTVQSIANLLRRFNVEIPAEVLRTRNAAAVLVTAEVSPYLRAGGRFEITISSIGDARSLRGGTLWMTPLLSDPDAPAVASAQGSIVMSDGNLNSRNLDPIETSGRIPSGGILEGDLGRTSFANVSRLVMKEPDISTATKIVAAINQSIGANTATVEDPGSISLTIAASPERAATLVKIQDLKITPDRLNRLIIDGRDGTVVAGGDMTVGSAVVSHGGVTLAIGSAADAAGGNAGGNPGSRNASNAGPDGPTGTQAVRIQSGASVQKVAAALQAIQTTPTEMAAIFESLREIGALSADVSIR